MASLTETHQYTISAHTDVTLSDVSAVLLPGDPNPWAEPQGGVLRVDIEFDVSLTQVQRIAVQRALLLVAEIIPLQGSSQHTAQEVNNQGEFKVGQSDDAALGIGVLSLPPRLLRFQLDPELPFAGQASLPSGPEPGLIRLNPQFLGDLTPGGRGFDTLLHELGHALGLKHPGLYEAGDSALGGAVLSPIDDGKRYTVMSYFEEFQQQQRIDWGLLDVAALRALYGTREKAVGNNWYVFQDDDGLVLQTLVDDGGRDVIDLSALSKGASLSLVDGSLASIGVAASGLAAVDNLGIALGTAIEFVIGTAHDDYFIGSERAETWLPGFGHDFIDAGEGTDIVRAPVGVQSITTLTNAFSMDVVAPQDAVRLERIDPDGLAQSTRWKLEGPGFSYDLQDVERLHFAGGGFVALDLQGHAGQAYRLLEAVLQQAPSKSSVGAWMAKLDQGLALEAMAAQLLSDSEGLLSLQAAQNQPQQFVQALYQQILGRSPDEEGFNWWLRMLEDRAYAAPSLLIAFTESLENQIEALALIGSGIAYDPPSG